MSKHLIPADRLDELDRQLLGLPRRCAERRRIIHERAAFYGVSETSLYRALRQHLRPKALRRSDHGAPRVLSRELMERYCELIAAVKIRTMNRKGRCLSTGETIRLMEEFGIETPEGLVKVDAGLLKLSTVNPIFFSGTTTGQAGRASPPPFASRLRRATSAGSSTSAHRT